MHVPHRGEDPALGVEFTPLPMPELYLRPVGPVNDRGKQPDVCPSGVQSWRRPAPECT